jgi:FemAB-related protein (PEP-CTERM system-associated)
MTDDRTHDAPLTVEPWRGEAAVWDAFVRDDPRSTFCHLHGWTRIMEGVLGHRLHYRVARDSSGELAGVLPLVEVKSLIFGHYLVSMPFLNYGGPLGSEPARGVLAEAARELARDRGVDLLELRDRYPVPGDLQVSNRKVTVILDLPQDPEVLWTDLKGKVRSQVRRPRKAGMEARVGRGEVEAFYGVFSEHMRDLGTPVLPRALFEALVEVFPEEVRFCTVYSGERPVAVGCGFVHGSEFEITWASALWEFSREAPNMLLYWTLMEEMIEEGREAFNFGRCTPDSGTHRFKRQWGSRDVPLPWAQWSADGTDATPSPEGGIFEKATSVWQKLPLPVANAVGPFLSRQIP